MIFHGYHILVGVIRESVQTKDQLLSGRAGRFIQTRTTSLGGKRLSSPHPGLALAVQWLHEEPCCIIPMASLGLPHLWVTVGSRGGMETVWSAWLFAACLPSASQGARTCLGVVAVTEKVGTATKAWIRGTSPCCCRLHLSGDS